MPLFDGRAGATTGGGVGVDINDVVSSGKVFYQTLAIGDITNKYVTVPNTVVTASKVQANIVGGTTLEYGVDFTANATLNRIEWNGLALDGLLSAGDTLRIVYNSTDI